MIQKCECDHLSPPAPPPAHGKTGDGLIFHSDTRFESNGFQMLIFDCHNDLSVACIFSFFSTLETFFFWGLKDLRQLFVLSIV